jgi:hypothetical protein
MVQIERRPQAIAESVDPGKADRCWHSNHSTGQTRHHPKTFEVLEFGRTEFDGTMTETGAIRFKPREHDELRNWRGTS